MSSIVVFLNQVLFELGRVKWPTRRELVMYGITVFFVVLVSAVMLGIMDAFFGYLVKLFIDW